VHKGGRDARGEEEGVKLPSAEPQGDYGGDCRPLHVRTMYTKRPILALRCARTTEATANRSFSAGESSLYRVWFSGKKVVVGWRVG
jgi:hypothetical protein